ncbi:MAG: hypothetical protein A2W85_12470 [Bacteroidetes bacterium GWF2_41_31]|nr:MAG: hypothetical protein A2W85_12470 [Bacteroidetes bacterium GWF2_41_31]
MKQKLLTTFMLALMLVWGGKDIVGQIISQYVETSSGSIPKGIEIWNNTATSLDFLTNNLIIKKGTNGGAPAADYTLNSGTLASGSVIVIGTSDMEVTATGNGAAFFLKVFTFNGDDALEVWYGATKTDVFGNPGSDPGTGWSGNGVQTYNQNIALKSGFIDGDTDGWTDPSLRFETVCSDNCLTGFGIAPVASGTPTAATPTFSPAAGLYYTTQNVTISTITPLATIYYTTDGTDPDNTDTEYTTPVAVSSTTNLKAIAYATGFDPSTIGSAIYSIPIEVADIATLRGGTTGTTVYKLTGEAILTFQQTFRNQKFIQDGTAGVLIDDPSGFFTTVYNVGDGITGIYGTLTLFNGMLEFVPVADPGVATSVGNAIVPVIITATEFLTNFDNYESRVVEIQDLIFADGGGSFVDGIIYPVTEAGLTDFNFRTTFFAVDYIGTTIPVKAVNIVGIPNERFGSAYYLTARNAADITGTPVIPLGTSGIILAILLISAALFIRRGKLF